MSRSLLADAFEHHVWATLRLIDACADLTAEQLATAVPGTYGSILDTLRHTVGADCSYLALLSNGAREEVEEASLDLPALRAAMAENEPIWAALLADEPDPAVEVVRRRDDGSESGAPMGVRLAQAVHHGTDHRSQVCTALTELGIEPPEIDVWAWAWDHDRLRETEPTDG
ncbi:MAG TPA: DinB family protein [Candidatus Angelobacter sp.]|nr:DinB family protein [Candidatus Angelobacter sp.]